MSLQIVPIFIGALLLATGCQTINDFFSSDSKLKIETGDSSDSKAISEEFEFQTKCYQAYKNKVTNIYDECKDDASKGDAYAMLAIAKNFYYGYNGKRDYTQAFNWYSKAADANLTEAQYGLGVIYAEGIGVDVNISEAKKLLTQAANKNYEPAMVYLADIYTKGTDGSKDPINAVALLEKAVNLGNTEAMVKLAQANLNGLYSPLDCPKIQELLDKAVKANETQAYAEYAKMYNKGICVSRNDETSQTYLEKAANTGDYSSMYNLGLSYDKNQEYQKAIKWYKKAAINGHAKAQLNLGNLYAQGDGINKNLDTALYWFLEAAKLGLAKAQYNASVIYYTGNGVGLKDFEQSYIWAKVAENCRTPLKTELNSQAIGLELDSTTKTKAVDTAKEMYKEYGCIN
jgi:uncharacterized protein